MKGAKDLVENGLSESLLSCSHRGKAAPRPMLVFNTRQKAV